MKNANLTNQFKTVVSALELHFLRRATKKVYLSSSVNLAVSKCYGSKNHYELLVNYDFTTSLATLFMDAGQEKERYEGIIITGKFKNTKVGKYRYSKS